MSLAVVFPGQGSQQVGMLADLLDQSRAVQDTFTAASEAVSLDLKSLALEGPAEELNRTENTQPVLLTASVAIFRALAERGLQATHFAGHSLGEYSALVAGNAVSLEDAVRIVQRRGQLMQQAVPSGEGAMAAILGLDDADIAAACAETAGTVAPANFNSPGQVVIAGAAPAVQAAADLCKEKGAKRAVLLDVSVPSHTELMAPAAEAFAEVIGSVELRLPELPVIHNVDATAASTVEELKQKLLAQLASPVRWTQCVQALIAAGVDRAVESGPGNTLCGLIKRIDRSVASKRADSIEAIDAVFAE